MTRWLNRHWPCGYQGASKLHGGTIEVESDPDRGSAFAEFLPLFTQNEYAA